MIISDELLTCVQLHHKISVRCNKVTLRKRTYISIKCNILILFVNLVLILIFNRKDFDMKKVEQVQMMQRLAKQQHELMKFTAKTEELVLRIETNADLSHSDIMRVKDHMNKWCEVLGTLEEKKKRIREEQKKKEREKREKPEEAKNRRKEKEGSEKREKEEAEKPRKEREKRKKKEAEKRRKEEEKEEREREDTERRRKEKEEREKRKKEEAEKPRKNEEEKEKREKEEAERRRKETEEREAEEKRIKQEEEKKRRDWKNWLPFM